MEILATMVSRKVSILIPLYNEEEFVGTLLLRRVQNDASKRRNANTADEENRRT